MAKGRTFAAKLAHEQSTEGKMICPNCETEIKRIKIVRARSSKTGSWMPKYEFAKICKCNEKEIMNGKV
ncbi:MAG: hypothetical protein K8S56_03175 [Candidatus Cloacimonetes bacterium]|nr:hypothetical protein [Candidatus Cloacimonadota bacterium]